MVKLAHTPSLGVGAARLGGASPSMATIQMFIKFSNLYYFYEPSAKVFGSVYTKQTKE